MQIRRNPLEFSAAPSDWRTRGIMAAPAVRKQDRYVPLSRDQFRERFFARFYDPAFAEVAAELEKVFEKAWDGYIENRKSPRVVQAGPDFSDPAQNLPVEWLETRHRILAAEATRNDAGSPSRVLIVNGSTRSEHSCPGEISKTRRLAQAARSAIEALPGYEVDFLDLSTLADEPLKVIHPCKACVSTAMPLCHWPCSCYPNHALGQTNDWMAEIYPRWVAAHGVFILCPVHWYQTPASLKLMIDRLVCADGGNPDPTTTHGKDPALAKEIELRGMALPEAPRRPRVRRRDARRRRRHRDAPAPAGGLAERHGTRAGRPERCAGRVDRLLPAVRDQPRGSRQPIPTPSPG